MPQFELRYAKVRTCHTAVAFKAETCELYPLNLCRPDDRKSCAACCGLYNVPDGTRPTLLKKLEQRTVVFQTTARTVQALMEFEKRIRKDDPDSPLEESIHVCEFAGFMDTDARIPGCLLHPCAPGNNGVDFRGMCYYGSMACKAFFCPAWENTDVLYRDILARSIDDWHLYGLVITDTHFVRSLFGLLKEGLGGLPDPDLLLTGETGLIFKEMVSWKDTWPFKAGSRLRRSRYYVRTDTMQQKQGSASHLDEILESLKFTFGMTQNNRRAREYARNAVQRLVAAYGR